MNKIVNGFLLVCLMSVSSFASANWNMAGGYSHFNEDDEGIDIDLGLIYVGAGYEYRNGNTTIMPEIRLGQGVNDDTFQNINVEIDNLFVLSLRGQYNVSDSFAVFLQPSYARLEVTASGFGESFSEDDWEFGFGGGAKFQFTNTTSVELVYETYDGTDVLSVGARYKF